jgi:hypothetical protein
LRRELRTRELPPFTQANPNDGPSDSGDKMSQKDNAAVPSDATVRPFILRPHAVIDFRSNLAVIG